MSKVRFKYFLAYGWTCFILVGSLMSTAFFKGVVVDEIMSFDKVIHFFLYAFCSYFWCLVLQLNNNKRASIFKSFSISFILGTTMEVCQYAFTTYRTFEWNDVAANTIGAIIGVLLFYKLN
jgi:VanZ family protein